MPCSELHLISFIRATIRSCTGAAVAELPKGKWAGGGWTLTHGFPGSQPLSDWGAGAAEGLGGWGQEGSGTNSQACTWHRRP